MSGIYVVKWYNDPRGFGFLSTAQGDAIVARCNVAGQQALNPGDLVHAELEEQATGLVAMRVRPVNAKAGDWEAAAASILGYSAERVRDEIAKGAPCPVRGRTWGDLKAAVLTMLLGAR